MSGVERALEFPIMGSAIALIWLKPLSYTIRSIGRNKKQWVYYWMILGGLAWLETHIFPGFVSNRYILYYTLKSIFCFVLGDPLNASLFDIKPFRSFSGNNDYIQKDLEQIKDEFKHEIFRRLIHEDAPLGKIDKLEHPWATPPDRISSLMMARIGMLAIDDKISETDYGRICRLGILDTLVNALKSNDRAKSDNALLALLYLTENNKHVKTMCFQNGGLAYAGNLMRKSDRLIVKLTAATLCRNMYFLRGEAQDLFFKEGLPKVLIQLLTQCDTEHCEEMLRNLVDFVMDRDQKINNLHADFLKQNGLGEALKKVKDKFSSNQELQQKIKFVEEALL